MTNLRRQAIGRTCQIRLPGCNTEPCCLAHWRQSGISGMGMKSPDLLASFACHACHTRVDTTGRGDPEVQFAFAQGVFRTQAILIREGIITWGKAA